MASAPLAPSSSLSRPRLWATGSRLAVASLVWLLAIGAALVAALLRGVELDTIAPLGVAAVLPALVSLALAPLVRRDWAQLVVILAWLGLAIAACLAIGFTPMAILFLAAPAAAALFEREKVVEAMVMAALLAAALFYATSQGVIPEAGLGAEAARWGAQAGIVATVMFLASAMFGAASQRVPEAHQPHLDVTSRAAILGAVPGPVLSVTADDRVDFASREAMDVFGIESDFGVMPVSALLSADPEASEALRALMDNARRTRRRQTGIIRARDRAGLKHRLEITASNVRTPAGGRGRLLLQAQDLTDREAQLEALRRERVAAGDAQPDRSLFFAGVSHELRTPLNAIIGFSDMMRSRMFGPLPGRYAEYADLIHDSGQHMLDLIGDVLDLSKVEAGRYELVTDIFDAGDVVRSSVKMVRPLADTAEVALRLDVPEDDVLIEADRKAVRQILLNLLSNAIKFSPRGGHVDVAMEVFASEIVLGVEDGGPGMSAAEIARIGEPFAQGASARMTEERGSGLGLALVSRLVALHDGAFEIESREDGEGGTRVEVTLPRTRAD